jgi:uncharacterized protein (DUF2147 family)
MRRLVIAVLVSALVGVAPVLAADSPVGKWNTVDEKSGKVVSQVELYDQGGKLFGKITGLTEPNNAQGKPKLCKDGKIYKAEVWPEDGKLKVRGYLGIFYRTQTWQKGG